MGERKFVPLSDSMEALERARLAAEARESQKGEGAPADLGVVTGSPEPKSLGAAARDFNKDKKKGGKNNPKKNPGGHRPSELKKTETQEDIKTKEELAKELVGINNREDLLAYLGGLKGSIKINGHAHSLPNYIVPRAQKILGGSIPWAAMEVDPLGKKLQEIIKAEKERKKLKANAGADDLSALEALEKAELEILAELKTISNPDDRRPVQENLEEIRREKEALAKKIRQAGKKHAEKPAENGQISPEQEAKFSAILKQIPEQEAALMAQIKNGVYARLKDASKIYIFTDKRHKDEIRKLPKEQQAIVNELIGEANVRISEAMKAYQEKAEKDKELPRENFMKEYGSKFGVDLFDAGGRWMRVKECLENGKVTIVSGEKNDAKGKAGNVSIERALELLGHYTIIQGKGAPKSKAEVPDAVSPAEAGPKKDQYKEVNAIWQKIESKFSELFDWGKIENEINKRNQYSSQKTREKLKGNLFQMRKRVVEGVDVFGWFGKGHSEDEIDKLIIESFSAANNEINNSKGYKNFHKLINEICATVPAEPTDKKEGKKSRKKSGKPDRVVFSNGKPNLFIEETELQKWKTKADRQKNWKLAELSLGSEFKPKDDRQIKDLIEIFSQPGRYKIKSSDIIGADGSGLAEEDLAALENFMESLNGEIEEKRKKMLAQLEKMLSVKVIPAGQADETIEQAKSVLAELPTGEKYLGEEISEEKIKEVIMDSENLGAESPTPEPIPEPRTPEVDPEEKERTARERQERLAQLKMEVDQARKDYVEEDFKKNKAHKRLGRFFGNLFDNIKGSTYDKSWEADKDVAQYQQFYESKLFEYKNLCLEDAKENGVLGKGLGIELTRLSINDNIELAAAHDQVKIEHYEGTSREFVVNKMHDAVEWYKKLPQSQKWMVVGAFGLASVATAGGAFAGLVGYGVAGRRVFMGMVTGTTVAMGLESGTRKNMEIEKEMKEKEFATRLEGKSDEEIYNLIKENINEINTKQELKLNKTKNKNLRNLAAGIGIGTLIGSGAASEILRGGWHKLSEFWQHNPGGIVEGTAGYYDAEAYREQMEKEAKERLFKEYGIGQSTTGATESVGSGGAMGPGLHSEAPVGPALENPVILEVQKGSSLEGTIIEHLKGTGMSAEEAGRKAHSMAVEYAKREGEDKAYGSLIHPGANIEISPDGSKIELISDDDNLGYLPEKETVSGTVAATQPEVSPETGGAEAPMENIGSSSTEGGGRFFAENTPENEVHHGIEVPENGTGEYAIDPETARGMDEMGATVGKINVRLEELDGKILKLASGQYEGEDTWPNPETKLDELREQKQMLEQTRQKLVIRMFSGYNSSLRKLIYGGIAENVDKMSRMPAAELLDNKNSSGYKFFARVMNSQSPKLVELQRHVSPLKGEKVDDWILRISKIMEKVGIRKI